MEIIDLRSDTLTKPSQAMREAMASAPVGDDVYGEDPTVNKLQDLLADMLGKEAAMYVPSGSMANQMALNLQSEDGNEIICEANAHVFFYETGSLSFLSRLQAKTIKSEFGEMPLDELEAAIRPDIYYFPRTSVIAIENTHNHHGGIIMREEYINSVSQIAKKNNIKLHLDGARFWNALVESDKDAKTLVEPFDSISVCLSKGLGAPVGSVLVGSKEMIDRAWRLRKVLGGGMRQAGIIAAGGLYALENNLKDLKKDNDKAKRFAKALSKHEFVEFNLNRVHTNIATFKLSDEVNADEFVTKCKEVGILCMGIGGNKVRTVFHLDVSDQQTDRAAEVMISILNNIK